MCEVNELDSTMPCLRPEYAFALTLFQHSLWSSWYLSSSFHFPRLQRRIHHQISTIEERKTKRTRKEKKEKREKEREKKAHLS